MLRRFVAGVIVLGAIAFAGVSSASASCAGGGPRSIGDQLAISPVVFVGSVVYTSDQDRVARD